jgi:hypothetical protein
VAQPKGDSRAAVEDEVVGCLGEFRPQALLRRRQDIQARTKRIWHESFYSICSATWKEHARGCGVGVSMEEQSHAVEAISRPLIEQCRREIAAAWAQIEAASEMLLRSRWLLARWREQPRMDEAKENARLASAGRSEAARLGAFVMVEPETWAPRARRARLGGWSTSGHRGREAIMRRADRHNRPRSASG